MAKRIGVLIVEDDPVWRMMLTRFINFEPDLHVLQAVATKEEAIAYCTRNTVDLVLMNINMSGRNLDGIEAILELNLMGIDAKIIALSSYNHEQIILDAFTAGAMHYVSKTEYRKIPEFIRLIYHSSKNSPQEVLLKEFRRLKEEKLYNQLTDAEKEIVMLYEKGHNRAEILRRLGKSESTVKNQINSILRKFNANSMKEVIRVIKNRGLHRKELD